VFRIVNGGTPTSAETNWGGDVQWATPIDLARHNGGRIERTDRTLTPDGLSSGSRIVGAGGLIVSTRAPIGYVAETTAPMAFNQGCRGLEPWTEVDIRYFRYQLGSMSEQLQSRGQGSTFVELSSDALAESRVTFPALGDQRAIADYLDAETTRIDALIGKKQQLIHLLEERLDALVDEHFSPGPFDPTVRLARLARVQTGVTLNAGKVNTGETVRLPYLRVANVQPGWLDLSEVKEVDVDLAAAARSLLQPGDVLMTEGGDIDKLGRGTVWRGEVENCLHQNHVFAVRPQPNKVDSKFLANVTRTSHARAYFESTGVQSTNLASTNSFKVADFRIPALDIEAQRSRCTSYEQSSRPLREISEKLVRQIGLLAEHRQALVTAAVTGEFAVPGAA
jgi:type I restriction enzyme S subunit